MRRRGGTGRDGNGEGIGGQGSDEPRKVPRSGISPTWLGAAVGAVLLLVFAIQNAERVDVDFLVFDAQVRVFSVIIVSAAIGFAVGWLFGRPSRAQRKLMRRESDD